MRTELANIIGILEIIDPKISAMEVAHFLKMIKYKARKLDEELRKSISASSNLQFETPESENQPLVF